MSAQRFTTGKRFLWKDREYEVKRLLPNGRINIEEIATGGLLTVAYSELVRALFDGELRFEIVGRQAKHEPNSNLAVKTEKIDLRDYPEHLVEIARYRLKLIQPLIELEDGKRTREAVELRVLEVASYDAMNGTRTLKNAVSVASVYRWLRDYRESGSDLRALIPSTFKRGGKGVARLDPEVISIVESAIRDRYYRREKVTIDDVVHEVAVRIKEENGIRTSAPNLKVPSRATVARRIDALDLHARFAAKHGQRAAKREFSQYGQLAPLKIPLERVEIDHTKLDLIVVDDRDNLALGRPILTDCIDVATRYPLGYYLGFEPASYYSVLECLYDAIRPKTDTREKYETEHEWQAFGIPSQLVIDNGKEFTGRDLKDACELLGISLLSTPVRAPHFKGTVERYFGTLNTMLLHGLPGTTFSNPTKRGDYDSINQACITLSELEKLINVLIVDVYAENHHAGLDGIPARRWENAIEAGFMPRLPPNLEELSVLLGRVSKRVVHKYGIEFECLLYNAPELAHLRARLRGESVKIKYHPGDLTKLNVYDPFEQTYLQVPALAQEYVQGLSLWKHRVIRSQALLEKGKVDLASLGQAKRKIQEIVDAAKTRKRISTRTRIARYETTGSPRSLVGTTSKDKGQYGVTPASSAVLSSPVALQPPTREENIVLPAKPKSNEGWELVESLPKSRRETLKTVRSQNDDTSK